jgi:predicted Fe-S protein YdhL (DUF1289 family)
MTAISTPCIGVCLIDSELKLCMGCGRTRDEIGGWLRFSEPERLLIMAGLKARLDAANGEAGPSAPDEAGPGNWRAGL